MSVTLTRKSNLGSTPPSTVNGLAYSPDGSILAVGHNVSPFLTLYDADTGNALSGPSSAPNSHGEEVAFSPDGSLLAVAHPLGDGFTVYETATWTKVSTPAIPLPGTGNAVAFSPDGSLLAVGHASSPYVSIFDTSDWTKLSDPSTLPAHTVEAVAFSRDGSLLAAAHAGTPWLTVYQTSDWSKLADPADLPSGGGWAVAFSRDDSMLAVGHNSSPYLSVYRTSDWVRETAPASPPTARVVGLEWAPEDVALFCTYRASPYIASYALPGYDRSENPASLPDGTPDCSGYSDALNVLAVGMQDTPRVVQYEVEIEQPITVAWPVTTVIGVNWPVTTFIGAYWPVTTVIGAMWPVTVEWATHDMALPWPVRVGGSDAAQSAWPVQMLSADVVGGLDGAGGWSAAPQGVWRAVVVFDDDTDISDRISGEVSVQIGDDAARTAQFAFLPAAPIQPMGLIGRRLRIAFAQAGGLNAQTLFRGVVDVPTINLDSGLITCQCHDQAQEMIAATDRERIDELVPGRWHVAVSGEPEDNFGYLSERIQSMGASWALDTDQSLRILPWRDLPRSVTVKRADTISGSLAVDLPSRDQVRTRIGVRFQYRYPVHRARGVVAQYAQPLSFFAPSVGALPKPSYLFLTVAMVEGAAERPQGWSLRNLSIDHPAAGTYQLGPSIMDGFYIINPRVARDLALGFTAHYSTRWQQTVTEDYHLTVRWAALEDTLGGPVQEQIGATLESGFPALDWSSDETVEPILDVPQVGDVATPYRAPGADVADAQDALRTLLDRAWVKLWAASRSGRVRFALPCRPDLWLDTWVTLDDPGLLAAGKITEIAHVLDMQTGEAVTSVAVAVGLPGDESASLPEWTLPESPYATAEPGIEALSAQIGTFVGGLETSPAYDEEAMIGFLTNAEGQTYENRNYYPHELSIGWPAIDATDRDPVEALAEQIIDVDIPTDKLEISP